MNRTILTVLCLCAPIAAAAQESITLEQALEVALDHSPVLRARAADPAIALAEARDRLAPKNPEADLEFRDLLFDDPELEFAFSQPIRIGYRQIRHTYARAFEEAATLEQKAARVQVLNAVNEAYFRAIVTGWQEHAYRRSLETASRAEEELAAALETGQASASEAAIFRAQRHRFEAEIDALRNERASLMLDLAHLIGLPGKRLGPVEPALVPIPRDVTPLVAMARERAPLRRQLRARILRNEQELVLARTDAKPEITPGLLIDRTPNPEGDTRVGLGLSMELPFRNKNRDAIRAAEEKLTVAESLLAYEEEAIEDRVRARHEQAVAAERAMYRFRRTVLPAYEEAYDKAEEELAAGQANILQRWQLQREINQQQQRAVEFQIAAIEARIRLERLVGARIEELNLVRAE